MRTGGRAPAAEAAAARGSRRSAGYRPGAGQAGRRGLHLWLPARLQPARDRQVPRPGRTWSGRGPALQHVRLCRGNCSAPDAHFVTPNNDTLYMIAMCDVRERPAGAPRAGHRGPLLCAAVRGRVDEQLCVHRAPRDGHRRRPDYLLAARDYQGAGSRGHEVRLRADRHVRHRRPHRGERRVETCPPRTRCRTSSR